MKNIWAFVFGGLFSIGLMLSGMSNPKKVLDFLDFFGQWDPSLAFVMLGAVAVAFIPFQRAIHQQNPKTVYGDFIDLPKNNKIDSNLLIGSLVFGIGWGIAGICPAPSLILISLGHYQALYFIVAMFTGMLIQRQLMGKHL